MQISTLTKIIFLELQLKFLFNMNVVFGFSKVKAFLSIIILNTSLLLFLNFETSSVVFPKFKDDTLVVLYGLSTVMDYQIPNPIYIYIYIYIYIFKKKTKDRLIQDYKFISIPYFQFLM